MPRTGTTLCHPKIGYVNAMLLFRSWHLAINSPLGRFNGDNADSPPQNTRRTKLHGDSKVQSSHVRRYALPSQPSQLLITQFRLKHNLSTSLAARKANQIFHAANKNYSKNTFRPSASYLHHLSFIYLTISEGPHKLSEETTQRKHTHTHTPTLHHLPR